MRTKNSEDSSVPRHLDEDDLVSYLDGELLRDEQEQARAHLESCWNCRSRLNGVQSSIENFLRVRQESLLPKELPPSDPALEMFLQRLAQHSSGKHEHSLFRLSLVHWRALSGHITSLLDYGKSALVPSRLMVRVAGVLVAVIVAGLIILSNRVTTVSASEFLERATMAQAQKINITQKPVVHQRLQVLRKTEKSSTEESLSWEIWNDTTSTRFRQSVNDRLETRVFSSEDQAITNYSSSELSPSALVDLENIFRANHMDWRWPLSPVSYQAWRTSLDPKQEEVIRSVRGNGLEVLTLKTSALGTVVLGGITEAELSVRASDWHPFEQRLRVKGANGVQDQEYVITETAFDVVNLNTLEPTIFSETKQVASAPMPGVIPAASPSPSPTLNANPNPMPLAVRPVATASLEIEVLDLLHKVGADVTEQVSVMHTPEGLLEVQGIVETDQRKGQILQALAPVADNPAVKIDVQTVAEASRRLDQQKKSPSGPTAVSRVEVTKGAIPVEDDLRRYFSEGQGDEKIRQFSARMINRSQQALFQASALKRIANRFTTEQLRTLDPNAKAKWLDILRAHARVIGGEAAGLRQELQPIFFSAGQPSDADNEAAITDDVDLTRAIARLYELASTNDRVIRSAFTLSSEGAVTSAIKTPQFWRSLRSTEKLAAAVEKAQ